ncbi:MAG: hypothetical protein V3V14_09685 [Saprospiraceae bacterium]
MKKVILLAQVLLFSLVLNGQLKLEDWKGLSFRNIGPAGMSGRVTAIDVDLSDSDRIFIGTASGGVWLSENGGISWVPIFDKQPVMSIGSLKINQNNPSEIWVGTGEGNPRNSLNTGAGIYKSIDGGKTWKLMGLKGTKVIHRIIIDQNNSNIIYAGAMGSPWGPNKERGLFKTNDGGKTWKNILYINNTTGIGDMVADPTNPNKLMVAMYQHMRTPWDFVSGGEGSSLHLTYDGGESWKKITPKEGLPKGELGRIGLAIAPSMPNIIYALVEAKENGLYKSTDGGEKWKLVSKKNIGNRPFYYSEIYVDPTNENRIYNLWSYVSKSEDGGKTFKTIMDYGNNVHPDHHAFWIHPNDPTYLINGNDGGLNISRDRGESWQFIHNIPVGQFYHINVDNDWPYNVYGGMQDNGSWAGPSMVLKRGGIRNYDFQEISFGDGFDVVPNMENSRYGWSMSQGGYVGYYDRKTGNNKFVRPVHPDGKILRFNWNAAIAQDPFNNCGAYFGSQYLHYSPDCGDSWTILSDDLTTNDTTKQHADKSGGLTIDATQAENYTTILSIAPSSVDKEVIWVGTDDGNLQLSKDGGKTFVNLNKKLRGAPKGSWIPQIQASKTNAKEAFVVVNNYRKNDYSAYAYHTTNFGKSFDRIVDDSQVKGFVQCIVQDPIESNLLFLGTDAGLYMSLDKGNKWIHLNEGFPSVQVSDLVIHPREHDLVIGTFGRAIWILDDIRPLRKIAKEGQSILNQDIVAFDPPIAYQVSMRSYDGIRFSAQGEFVGDNKSIGYAKIGVWNKPNKDNKDEKEEKVHVCVLDSNQDTVRRFSRKIKSGYGNVAWYLDRDGVRYPSRTEPKKDADLPGGVDVLPGDYQVIITKGDPMDSIKAIIKTSTWVKVMHDPRIDQNINDLQENIEAQKNFEKTVGKAAKAFKQLMKAKKNIKTAKSLVDNQPKNVKSKVDSLAKILNKAIDSLELVYMMPKNIKGIQRNTENLMSKLFAARGYIYGSWGKPGANAMNAVNIAETMTKKILEATNQFIEEDWYPFKAHIKTLDLKVFEELELIE